ncbi:hypothetical protein TNCV_83261 [Trichonephila clavipes]|nr:hypothetical protein TNCV_83261 [Trichonephila clavipes]
MLLDTNHKTTENDNFKIFVDSETVLVRDLGIVHKFFISKLRKKPHLFDYEDSDEPVLKPFQQMKIAFYFAIIDHEVSSDSKSIERNPGQGCPRAKTSREDLHLSIIVRGNRDAIVSQLAIS